MLRYCIIALLVCLSISSQAETPTHAYSNLDLVSNDSTFDLAEVLQYQEPADRYADRSVSNDSYMITYREDGYHVTLFEKLDNSWEFKSQLGLNRLLNLDMEIVSRLYIEFVSLNSDASVDIAYSLQNVDSHEIQYDIIRAYPGPDGYDEYESFGISCCQSIQNMNITDDLALIRSNRELHVFRIGASTQSLGIYRIDEYIRDYINVVFLPDINRILVSGRAIRGTEPQGLFVEYQYELNDQGFELKLNNSIVRFDDDSYSDRASIFKAQDSNNFLVHKSNEQVAVEFIYSAQNDTFSEGKTIDFTALVDSPYFVFVTSFVLRDNQLFGIGYRGLFQMDLNTPSVVNQLLTAEQIRYVDIGSNLPRLANVTDSEFVVTYDNSLTHTFSREDNSSATLINSLGSIQISEVSELSEEFILGINNQEIMVININSGYPELVFSKTYQELVGSVYSSRLIDNTVSLLSDGLIHELTFDLDEENKVTYTISSSVILDADGEVYEGSLYQVYFEKNLETTISLSGDGNGLNIFKRDGNTYRLTYEITRDLSLFASIRSFERFIFEDNILFLLDPYDHIFYIYDFSGEQPHLVSQLYDETLFELGSYLNVDGEDISVISRDFHTSLVLNDEGEIEVGATTSKTGTWHYVGKEHSLTVFERRLLRLREKDPTTGIYESLSELEFDMQFYNLRITDSYAIVRGQEYYYTFNPSPKILKIFSFQRAPIALQGEYSIVGNQGEPSTVDLTSLFLEIDKYDNLVFESDLDLSSIGWNIAGNVLEKVDLESFGDSAFTLTATDNSGKTASIDFSVSFNRRPQLTQDLPEISLVSGETQSIDLNEYFVDDQGQTITFSLRGDVPQGVTLEDSDILTIDIETSGQYVIGIDVMDNLGAVNEVELLASIAEKPAPTPAPTPTPSNNSGSSGGSASPVFFLFLISLGIYRNNRRKFKDGYMRII